MLAAFCGIAMCAPLHAQKIVYSYDSGGNRTQKRIIVLSAGAKGSRVFAEDEEDITAVKVPEAQDGGIAIQTDGDSKVTLTVSEEAWAGEGVISVFSANGGKVTESKSTARTTEIDLSDQPSGIYLLTVKTGRRTKTWRIAIR
ncbi:MAG: T9SS type A sorting domain-containing protein [Prevotella sp.]|nr:T9SS type A sorting domain-containing protein [Prevotella sp.]